MWSHSESPLRILWMNKKKYSLPLHRSLDSYFISLVRSYDFYLLQIIIELIKVDAHKKSQGIIAETKVNLVSDKIRNHSKP